MFCRAACLMAGGNVRGHRKYNEPLKSACGSAGLSVVCAQSQSISGYGAPHPRCRREHGIQPGQRDYLEPPLCGLRSRAVPNGQWLLIQYRI